MSGNSFEDLLSEEIAKQGATVRRFAQHAGLSHEIVRQYCLGNKLPTAKSFNKILAALKPIPEVIEECLGTALSLNKAKRGRSSPKDAKEQQATESALARQVRMLTELLLSEADAKATTENYEYYRGKVLEILRPCEEKECPVKDQITRPLARRKRLQRK